MGMSNTQLHHSFTYWDAPLKLFESNMMENFIGTREHRHVDPHQMRVPTWRTSIIGVIHCRFMFMPFTWRKKSMCAVHMKTRVHSWSGLNFWIQHDKYLQSWSPEFCFQTDSRNAYFFQDHSAVDHPFHGI